MLNMNAPKLPFAFFCLAASLNFPVPLCAQTPEWIWHDNKGAAPADGEVRFFRKTFTVEGPASKAVWGNVMAGAVVRAASRGSRQATPAEALATLPGFKVELIRSAEPGEGSWVCLTVDPKSRLTISPQD